MCLCSEEINVIREDYYSLAAEHRALSAERDRLLKVIKQKDREIDAILEVLS